MQMSIGMRALLVVSGTALLGAAYFLYLNVQPFPPTIARVIPLAWLAGAVFAGALAVRAVKSGTGRTAAGLALALNIPNLVFAALFTMAALMGG